MLLVCLACALTLTVLVGACSAASGWGEHVSHRPAPEAWSQHGVSSVRPSRHERLLGEHHPSPQGRLELPMLPGKLTPHPTRFDTRQSAAVKPEALTAALTRRLLSCALPPCQSRLADRPLIANCPARGPPRTV
jgi:hypothetical protein